VRSLTSSCPMAALVSSSVVIETVPWTQGYTSGPNCGALTPNDGKTGECG